MDNPARISQERGVTAEVSEVFSSLQGEGPYLGKKQIFVRFGRCNMHCVYCDELEKMREGRFSRVGLDELLGRVRALDSKEGSHHSVSLTGGEPLFYPRFLEVFLPELKRSGFATYLETNGTLPDALERVLASVDIVAMDIKPPSSTGDRDFYPSHRRFLELSAEKEVFVKVVVTAATRREEIDEAVALVAAVSRKIPFILQPETELTGINLKALDKIRTEFVNAASDKLEDVRVIPQMHKIWGVR